MTAPPGVAGEGEIMISATVSCWVRSPLEHVWMLTTKADPPRFYPRFGPLPAVESVSACTGSWDRVGRSRRLELSGGGGVTETITQVDERELFVYSLADFSGVFGGLVAGAEARWTFRAEEHGTRIEWTYGFTPRAGRGVIVHLIVALWWRRYMARVLPAIAQYVRETPSEKPRNAQRTGPRAG